MPSAVPVPSPRTGCVPPLPPHPLGLGQDTSPETSPGGRCTEGAEGLGDPVAVRGRCQCHPSHPTSPVRGSQMTGTSDGATARGGSPAPRCSLAQLFWGTFRGSSGGVDAGCGVIRAAVPVSPRPDPTHSFMPSSHTAQEAAEPGDYILQPWHTGSREGTADSAGPGQDGQASRAVTRTQRRKYVWCTEGIPGMQSLEGTRGGTKVPLQLQPCTQIPCQASRGSLGVTFSGATQGGVGLGVPALPSGLAGTLPVALLGPGTSQGPIQPWDSSWCRRGAGSPGPAPRLWPGPKPLFSNELICLADCEL